MAIPLIPAAVAGLGKLGIGAKLASALSAAKGLVGIGGAKQLVIPGMQAAMKGTGTRMAGEGLANAAFKSGVGKAVFGDMTKSQILNRVAPDALFGGIAALQTPGDIGDKLIAGTTSAVGGGLGGLALGRAGQRFGDTAGFLADAGGSIVGDMAGMVVGDTAMRGKDRIMGGDGLTPYERMSAQQQAEFAQQIRQQTLAGAGYLPGVRDQFMYENGLG